MPFPELNLKQAWLIPSAEALPNPNGTAPGWFVRRPAAGVIVALPGPPREMRPMWANEALPRLQAIGLGADVAARTYRLAGVGESQVAELLGEDLLRSTNPVVATYARVEAVDVRISAVGDDHRSASARSSRRRRRPSSPRLAGTFGLPERRPGARPSVPASGSRMDARRPSRSRRAAAWRIVRRRCRGSASMRSSPAMPRRRMPTDARTRTPRTMARRRPAPSHDETGTATALVQFARRARELGGSEVGIAVRMRDRTADLAVSIAISSPNGERRVTRQVFRTGTGNGPPRGPRRCGGPPRKPPETAPAATVSGRRRQRPRPQRRPEPSAAGKRHEPRHVDDEDPLRARGGPAGHRRTARGACSRSDACSRPSPRGRPG